MALGPDNIVALAFSLLLLMLALKVGLGKMKWFQANPTYLGPVLFIVAIFAVVFSKILKIVSFSAPFFFLVLFFIAGFIAWLYGMGSKGKVLVSWIGQPGMRTTLKIVAVCILFLAAGRVMGEQLLEEKTVTLLDPVAGEVVDEGIDVGFLFQAKILTMIFVVIIVLLGFLWVNGVL